MERFTGVTEKYYLATMQIFDEEGEKRKMKHKAARQGKGFLTIEQPRDIKKAAEQTRSALDEMRLPELDYFMEHCMESFSMTLDELESC